MKKIILKPGVYYYGDIMDITYGEKGNKFETLFLEAYYKNTDKIKTLQIEGVKLIAHEQNKSDNLTISGIKVIIEKRMIQKSGFFNLVNKDPNDDFLKLEKNHYIVFENKKFNIIAL